MLPAERRHESPPDTTVPNQRSVLAAGRSAPEITTYTADKAVKLSRGKSRNLIYSMKVCPKWIFPPAVSAESLAL